ncbi:spore cortex biosynthesis protein YabQ [Paraclostridium sordellii]|uniref:spore cortex biosynthesis protein YabQ n=1 Tax=Paraclostridium sordellii TaxID=1505 RepID=UPI0005E7E56D|nr:membrane protein [[Clostridium] sordellii] [Paeniclostridium sordellii]CEQ25711.1 membrane protein [[Clostridium] sordellii] [Paeniclostridium sordellii]
MIPVTQDLGAFFATAYGGIAIGILFDLYRAFKNNFNILKIFSLFYDVIFWLLVTGLVFITINVIESFDLRYYHFIALFIGFLIYYNTVSKLILRVLNKLIKSIIYIVKQILVNIGKISVNLYYVIIYSIHFLFDTIFYIPNLLISIFKFLKIKSCKLKKVKSKI